ncbi:hypothetical protein CDAR_202011 [Caerostris darwini]|uniref:Uncharacterized protein n=1 Tax=Caerostris darwini TaxID=1538125 RepID=A0AAV4MHD3_9ARAC|nr:hypothetical protein CDAR_202011 [Caerostris darwini]
MRGYLGDGTINGQNWNPICEAVSLSLQELHKIPFLPGTALNGVLAPRGADIKTNLYSSFLTSPSVPAFSLFVFFFPFVLWAIELVLGLLFPIYCL